MRLSCLKLKLNFMYKCVHVDMFYTFPAGIQNGFMLRMYNKYIYLSDGIVVIM